MGSVHVGKLRMFGCDFSSAGESSMCCLLSSFASLRALILHQCTLMPTQYSSELLLACASRPELTTASFDVDEEAGEVHVGPLDVGILALLFRDVGEDVKVAFRHGERHLGAIISDGFSKSLLEVRSADSPKALQNPRKCTCAHALWHSNCLVSGTIKASA